MTNQATKPSSLAPAILSTITPTECTWGGSRWAPSKSLKLTLFLTVTAWLGTIPAGIEAQDTLRSDQWRTGADFRRQLERPVSLDWVDNPLMDALTRLSISQQMAVFVDRRINPNQKVAFSVKDQPLRDALDSLASQISAGLGYVDSVIYIGPRSTAKRLATVAEMQNEHVGRLPKERRDILLKRTPTHWPHLAEPSDLLAELTQEFGLVVENPSAVTHDLWPENSLPPLTVSEKLMLLLAGFRSSFRWLPDGETIQLTRFPRTVFIERSYPGGREPADRVQALEAMLPQAFIEIRGKKIMVRSMLEDHWIIERQWSPMPATPRGSVTDRARKRYSLTVEKQLAGALLETLAGKLSLELEYASDVDAQLDERVTLSVQQATIHELFDAIAAPVGLAIQVDDHSVLVTRAASIRNSDQSN